MDATIAEGMHRGGIIIEGLAGAGKSQTIAALTSNSHFEENLAPYRLYSEEETFGEFMAELRKRPNAPPTEKFGRLDRVIRRAEEDRRAGHAARFMLERAHHSYYALLPEWRLYEEFDRRLLDLSAHVVLLWMPEEILRPRSLYRMDRAGWKRHFTTLYGSDAKALDALKASQEARLRALRLSALPYTVINTSSMEWDRYATDICSIVRALSKQRPGNAR